MAQKRVVLRSSVIGDLFTKYGLDANVLVDLVLYPKAKEYFEKRGYAFPGKFLCTLPQCVGECKGVLIHRYSYSEDRADAAIDKILEEFLIEKLPKVVIEEDISVVEEIGQRYGLNDEDVPIIYAFWKLKVNIVVVRDTAFENTARELNITIIKWPSFT